MLMANSYVTLDRPEKQARGLAEYAIDFLAGRFAEPDEAVLAMVDRFHVDSIGCAVSALAYGANAPTVLRREALTYTTSNPRDGVPVYGSTVSVVPEKAVVANCS